MAQAEILVVEDEHIVAEDLQRHLQRLGYGIAGWASSGSEAIEKAETTQPDLVLMDIRLKGGMDGIQAAQHIVEHRNIPIIFLTAYSDKLTVQRAKTTAPFGYVLKPFEERDLHITIELALYKHEMERKLRESQQWLATTVRCINDAVIATDSRGSITLLNPAAESLTGWLQGEAIQRAIDDVLKVDEGSEPSADQPSLQAVLSRGVTIQPGTPSRLVAKDGTEMPIEYNAAPLQDDQGRALGMVVVFRDATARTSQVAALEYASLHDPVTGLPNRTVFYDRLQQAILVGRRERIPLAAMVVELPDLQAIASANGSYVSDLLLQQFGQRVWDALRKSDTVARLTDDRFGVLLPGVKGLDGAVRAIHRILKSVGRPFPTPGGDVTLKVKIGVAVCPEHADDAQTLMDYADTALRSVKESGGFYAGYAKELAKRKLPHPRSR